MRKILTRLLLAMVVILIAFALDPPAKAQQGDPANAQQGDAGRPS